MSMYNMIFGMNNKVVATISAIVGYRIDEQFPRFRDTFFFDDEWHGDSADFFVLTRMGGGNRECQEEWGDCTPDDLCPACIADKIEEGEACLGSYDYEYDCTYRVFAMKFTTEQRELFNLLREQDPVTIAKLENRIKEMFPSKVGAE